MRKEVNFGTASFLIAGVVLAVLTIVPDVGWIIRQQARILVGGRITPITNPPNQRETTVLRDNPNDYLLQLGGAFHRMGNEEEPSEDDFNTANRQIVARLRMLQTRFPDEPSLSAHLLRFLCTNRLLNHRKELPRPPKIFGPPPYGPPGSESASPCGFVPPEPAPTDAETLKLMESIAAQGEAVEPANAFFPTMRAIACLAQGRDAEAHNALHRAATKPRWDDYIFEEIEARWKLQAAAHGEMGAFQRFQAHFDIGYPHYDKIRLMARIVAAHAAERERQGKTAEGLALRKYIARFGARIRADSTLAGGSLFGGRVTLLATDRPGGIPLLSDKEEADYSEDMARSRYIVYLNRIGAADEARWFAEEGARLAKAKAIHERAVEIDGGINELTRLAQQWWTGVLLLLNGLWILLLGGLAALLAQTRRMREGQPLSHSLAWGVGYTLIGPFLVFGLLHLINALSIENEIPVYAGVPILTGLLLLPLFWLKRGTDWRGYWRNIGAFLATSVACIALAASFPLSLYGAGQSEFNDSYFSLSALMASTPLSDLLMGKGLTSYYLLYPGLLPALWLVGLAGWSWRRNVPVSVGVVRGFQKMSLPLASFLLLAYAFLVVFTLSSEIEVTKSLRERGRQEGRYEARIVGEEWPR